MSKREVASEEDTLPGVSMALLARGRGARKVSGWAEGEPEGEHNEGGPEVEQNKGGPEGEQHEGEPDAL